VQLSHQLVESRWHHALLGRIHDGRHALAEDQLKED
jgi:hypothetical protein